MNSDELDDQPDEPECPECGAREWALGTCMQCGFTDEPPEESK
jgi:ribosomal protein L32